MNRLTMNRQRLVTPEAVLILLLCVLQMAFASGPAAAQDIATRPAATQNAMPPTRISLLQAAVLGVVEGVTEYLPVSSTGHLILASHAMGLMHESDEQGLIGRKLVENPAVGSFDIVIQLGAILAVLGLYRNRVGQMLAGLTAGMSSAVHVRSLRNLEEPNRSGLKLLGLLLVAFLPAAIVGYLFHDPIEKHLFGPIPVVWALGIGGVLMIVVEYVFHRRPRRAPRFNLDNMMFWQAAAVGLAQCLAMWPGTSRSMVTMLAAMIVGLNIAAAAEFSFLLALPTLGAATLYSGYKHFHAILDSAGVDGLIVGLVVSGVTAALAVKAFVHYLTRHGLIPFGIYRILLAGGLLAYFAWR